MTTIYTATITIAVWKEHACVGCATRYRYLFERKITGQSGNPQDAKRAARANLVKAIRYQVDSHPCPECGMYQPDMIGNQRSLRHWVVFWCLLPVLALVFFLALPGAISYATAGALLALATVLALAAHALIGLINPNANLDANRELAARRIEGGQLMVNRKARADVDTRDPGKGVGFAHGLGYAVMVAAVLCFLLPPAVKSMRRMKTSPDCDPEIVGPGDSATVWFPDRVYSVGGNWRGNAQVTVLNAAEAGVAPGLALQPETSTNSWSGNIRVKSSEKNSSSRLWVRVRVPNDPGLEGKTLRLRMDLMIVRPVATGNTFNDTSGTHSHTAALNVSGAGDLAAYRSAWWFGFLAGLTLSSAAGVMMALAARAFGKEALPSEVVRPEDDLDDDVGRGYERRRDRDDDDDDDRRGRRRRREEDD